MKIPLECLGSESVIEVEHEDRMPLQPFVARHIIVVDFIFLVRERVQWISFQPALPEMT